MNFFVGKQASNMPRTRKRSGKRNMRGNSMRSVDTRSMTSREPTSSIGKGVTSRSREETSSTTRTATKRRNTSACASHAKRHSMRSANSHRDSDSEDEYTEEPGHTPLTKADIPWIVNAVLSNISTEATAQRMTARMLARMFHISVSRLANCFFCMYRGS